MEDYSYDMDWGANSGLGGGYMPPTFDYGGGISGSGTYDVGYGPTEIYAPGGGGGGYVNPASYSPASYGPAAGGGSYTDTVSRQTTNPWSEHTALLSGGGGGGQGGGGRSSGGIYPGGQYQRAYMGSPERTLYNRYSQMLQNPAKMASDPAFKFLYNQGLQAMNRSLAARGMMNSGKSLNDSMAYGQGMASDYMSRMLPLYQAGASEELRRFMGPAGLMPNYTQVNNQATQLEGSEAAANELLPYYKAALGGGQQGSGVGWGGQGSVYAPRLEGALGNGYSYASSIR